MSTPAKTGRIQGRFAPGESGNASGRPPGARSKAIAALDAVGERGALAVVRAVIRAARKGDVRAAEIVLSRCWPARKGARWR